MFFNHTTKVHNIFIMCNYLHKFFVMYLNFFHPPATPHSAPTPRWNYPPMSGFLIGFWAIAQNSAQNAQGFCQAVFRVRHRVNALIITRTISSREAFLSFWADVPRNPLWVCILKSFRGFFSTLQIPVPLTRGG